MICIRQLQHYVWRVVPLHATHNGSNAIKNLCLDVIDFGCPGAVVTLNYIIVTDLGEALWVFKTATLPAPQCSFSMVAPASLCTIKKWVSRGRITSPLFNARPETAWSP